MKHVFVINPSAGPFDSSERIRSALAVYGKGYDYEVYSTTGPGDATRYVRDWIAKNRAVEVRFYACGGDGTLNEVVNGAAGSPHASVGCCPCGSGNDYVKYYGDKEAFLDIESQLRSKDVPVDLMEVNGRYCINVCSFGFDTTVIRVIAEARKKHKTGGRGAYIAGIVKAFFKSMRTRCRVKADGEVICKKRLLLCTAANGSYVGSSFRCAPYSVNDDGLMEVCLVKPMSRIRFLCMISSYIKGSHLSKAGLKKFLVYRRAKEVEIFAPSGFAVSVDGELLEDNHVTIKIRPGALRFALPGRESASAEIPA
jgi:diacylglycerol kinase (ATP)